MSDLQHSLRHMGWTQLVLALIFLCSYGLALGSLLGPLGRWRAGGVAAVAALAFGFFTDPWEHAVMLVAFALIGFGLFIAAAWLLTHGPAWVTHQPVPDTTQSFSMTELAEIAEPPSVPREELPARLPVAAPGQPGLGL